MTVPPLPRLSAPLRKAGIALRPEIEGDLPFARALYGEHRAAELAAMGWPEDAKARFLDDQFRLQRAHFLREYPHADFLIVERDGAAAGRLYVDRSAATWRLIEIGLAASARGKGLGAALIGWLMAHADAIELHVAHGNVRAAALYRRLGFAEIFGASATHLPMRWRRARSASHE